MRPLPLLFACLTWIVFLTLQARSVDAQSAQAQPYDKATTDAFLITRMVEKFHVEPRPLNHELSASIFSRLLAELDEEKIFLTREDSAKLSVYRSKLDEEILGRKSGFLQLLSGLYKQRLLQADT